VSFPYINAYQQFFDSSGSPLVSGTIEFRDPTSNNLINSYPTAVDADAPLTLSSTGAATNGLFLEDGVAYKVILKDAAGNTVATHDDVLCPTAHTQSTIGALFYPLTSQESSYGLTENDINTFYEPDDVRRHGYVGDYVADDTIALQTAINVASIGGADSTIRLPEGRAKLSDDIYLHYDVTNNPNFSSDLNAQGLITIQGKGAGDYQAFVQGGLRRGSVLHFDVNKGLIAGDGTNNSRGVWLRDLSVMGNTTTRLIRFHKVSRNTGIKRAFVWNAGTGHGVELRDCFLADLEDVYIYLDNTAGICCWITNPVVSAAIFTLTRVTAREGDYGVVFGNNTDNSGQTLGNIIMKGCQQKDCNSEGLVFGWRALGATVLGNYQEGIGAAGMRVYRGSRAIHVSEPFFFNSNATEGDVVLGESGGTAAVKEHVNVTIEHARHVNVNAAAYVIFSALDVRHTRIVEPHITFKSSGVGNGFTLLDEQQRGLVIERPFYSNAAATEITFPARVDLLISEDSLGRYTWEAPHTFNEHINVSGGYVTIPTATTTELENISSYINTGPEKVAGTLYRNSNTGKLVTAVGSADGDVWQDATGATVHTPS
jgi:hypothetical protein